MQDALGDRMKLYEGVESDTRFMPLLPILIRVDGRAFSNFTRGMERPFDPRMSQIMIETARHLCEETNAAVAYTQSDEISLLLYSDDIKSQLWFDGRKQKIIGHAAAEATLKFYELVCEYLPEYRYRRPRFDARAWQVPNKIEAVNAFVWREWDAVKNSISMAASHYYSHTELDGKNGAERQEMLFKKGVNWNDYPVGFKRGTYIQRKVFAKPFSAEELERLPEKHHARTDPNLQVLRSDWLTLEMPILTTILNREAVLFDGAEPITMESQPL